MDRIYSTVNYTVTIRGRIPAYNAHSIKKVLYNILSNKHRKQLLRCLMGLKGYKLYKSSKQLIEMTLF